MKTVLNYSAYYEVFSIGVVDSGYTAVARMLFSPLFDPHILLDKNGVPYEVNNQNAQGWSIGKDLIPKEIQKAANDKKWKELKGFVKEGAGAGGTMYTALALGNSQEKLRKRIEKVCK